MDSGSVGAEGLECVPKHQEGRRHQVDESSNSRSVPPFWPRVPSFPCIKSSCRNGDEDVGGRGGLTKTKKEKRELPFLRPFVVTNRNCTARLDNSQSPIPRLQISNCGIFTTTTPTPFPKHCRERNSHPTPLPCPRQLKRPWPPATRA